MFCIQDLSLKYGTRTLFDAVNLTLNIHVKYGLVGANGCGKSSFLKILSKELSPSGGEFTHPKSAKIGVLRQDYYRFEKDPIIHVVLMGKKDLWEIMQKKEDLLLHEEMTDATLAKLEGYEAEIERLGGYEAESQAAALLEGLGIPDQRHQDPLGSLSGGYKIRVLLAQLLFNQPDLLLLDEPTNYLDISSIAWLESYLKTFKGCTVICSHDRAFLNQVVDEILDIDYERIKNYKGNYDAFSEAKVEELIAREAFEENLEKKQKHLELFVTRFGAKATKAAQAQSKKKQIEKIEVEKSTLLQAASSRRYPSFHFQNPERIPAIALEVHGLEKSYGPKQVLSDISFEIRREDKIAIVGPNGVGKSTLLEILTSNTPQDGGEIKWTPNIKIGYFPQHFERELHGFQRPMDYLSFHYPDIGEQKLRSILGQVLFSKDDVEKSISQLSGGEKARLVIAKLMLGYYSVIILDEPTNHLDLESCDSLIEALENFSGAIICVSHNRYFISHIANHIFEITPSGFYDFLGNYEEYIFKRGQDFLSVKDFKGAKKEEAKKKEKVPAPPAKRKGLDKEISELEMCCQNKEKELAKMHLEMSQDGFYTLNDSAKIKRMVERKNEMEKEIKRFYENLEKLFFERDGF